MAVSWGAYESNNSTSRLRVGIEVTRSPTTILTTTTNVDYTVEYYVQSDPGDYSDTQTMSFGGGSFGGSTSFNNSGGTILVATKHLNNVPIYYAGTGSRTFSATISGAYDGVTPSHSVTVQLPARVAAPPDAPPAPFMGTVGASTAFCTWSAPGTNGDAIDRYNVSWESPGGSVVHQSATAYVREDSTAGLDPGTDYRVRVRAHNSEGWGLFSDPRFFTTDVALPGTPGGVTFSLVTATSARVSWSAPSAGGGSIDEYNLVVEVPPSTADVFDLSDTASPRDITGLTPSTTYGVRVRAHNEAGWGDFSALYTFTTADATPGAPTIGTLQVLGTTSVRVPYTAPASDGGSAITGFEVQRASDAGFTTGVVLTADSVSPFDATGLAADTTYWFRVRAVNTVGAGAWSAVKTATTEPAPPGNPSDPPQFLSVSAVGLTLRGVAGTATREFQLAENAGFTVGVVTHSTAAESSPFTGLTPGKQYFARYRMDSGAGFGAYSSTGNVTLVKRPVRWNGTLWADDIAYWNGTDWVESPGPVRVWNGGAWV